MKVYAHEKPEQAVCQADIVCKGSRMADHSAGTTLHRSGLASGFLADFVGFDFLLPHLTPLLDPLGTLVHDAGGRDAERVFVDGRQVIANSAPTLADAARIRAEAQRAAEALWARAADDAKPERHPV